MSTDREHLEGFKEVVYTRGPASREMIPTSICAGSALDEVKERVVSIEEPLTARVEQCRMQLHEDWRRKLMNAEPLELWQDACVALSDAVPVKRVTAVLHAREDGQRASSGDSEELSRRCECRKVAQTGQKYEPGVGFRHDVKM